MTFLSNRDLAKSRDLSNSPAGDSRQSLPTSGLVLVDSPRSGAQNMALDQRMLERADELGQVLLRIYRWQQPTLSLGYFQKYAERLAHRPSCDIDIVRRATGGGAIVHHHDWTYSIALPNSHLKLGANPKLEAGNLPKTRVIGASQRLYDCIHVAIVGWLNDLGLPASRFSGTCTGGTAKCNFLCFERRSAGDVVIYDDKVMGSAQRRFRGALLQHGSLLLSRSSHAPSLPGLQQLGPQLGLPSLNFGDREFQGFALRIRSDISALIGTELVAVQNVHDLVGAPEKLDLGKFTQPTWIGRR